MKKQYGLASERSRYHGEKLCDNELSASSSAKNLENPTLTVENWKHQVH